MQWKRLVRTGKSAVMAAALIGRALSAAADTREIAVGDTLSQKYGLPSPAIIAHRGDSFDAPESTLPSYQLARDLGADYLELDLQRTKDGVLIALHDNNLKRTTNVAEIYPDRADDPVSTFTLAELKKLDAGSWFNKAYPERARDSFQGLKILTLDEVRQVAESAKGPMPGLYIETKVPKLFPGIEKDLKNYLTEHLWIGPNAMNVANSRTSKQGRVILQTFEKSSLVQLNKEMPNIPKILLLWTGDGYIEAAKTQPKADDESWADYYARVNVASHKAYEDWLNFAVDHGAIGVGPSTVQTDHKGDFSGQFSYMELAAPWMIKMAHAKGLVVHAYTVDQPADLKRYRDSGVDGFFTNKSAVMLTEFHRKPESTAAEILDRLGY